MPLMTPRRPHYKYLERKHSVLLLANIFVVILFKCFILETVKLRIKGIGALPKGIKFKHEQIKNRAWLRLETECQPLSSRNKLE